MLAFFETEQMFWESYEDHKECGQILGGASSDLLSPRLLGINCQLVSAASAGGAQSKPASVAIQFLDALASLDLKLSVSQSVSESYFFRSSNSESVSH